jgi:hypothetical protein
VTDDGAPPFGLNLVYMLKPNPWIWLVRRERILVQRGWVPWASKDPAARPEGQLKGTVALTGIVRKGESVRWCCAVVCDA